MANFTEITSVDQWKEVLGKSKDKAFLLLKHSTTCPVSSNGYKEFMSFDSPVETYLVKVIENRAVSNEIASDLDVQHESPQVLLVSNGKASWSASHWKITKEELATVAESI